MMLCVCGVQIDPTPNEAVPGSPIEPMRTLVSQDGCRREFLCPACYADAVGYCRSYEGVTVERLIRWRAMVVAGKIASAE